MSSGSTRFDTGTGLGTRTGRDRERGIGSRSEKRWDTGHQNLARKRLWLGFVYYKAQFRPFITKSYRRTELRTDRNMLRSEIGLCNFNEIGVLSLPVKHCTQPGQILMAGFMSHFRYGPFALAFANSRLEKNPILQAEVTIRYFAKKKHCFA